MVLKKTSKSKRTNKRRIVRKRRFGSSALKEQIGGNYYINNFKIQPIEFIAANNLSFIQGCIIKYICRFDKKNGDEDIDKAIHYCKLLKELKTENPKQESWVDGYKKWKKNNVV